MTFENRMKTLEPTLSLSDRVAQLLREEILSGQYQVGQVLPSEAAMASTFGVSRTVMREAVSRLKADGLVSTRQGLGVIVAAVRQAEAFKVEADANSDITDILRIVELRRGFEVEAAGLAARRRTAEDLATLERCLATMEEALGTGDVECGVKADVNLHRTICVATHNPLYLRLFDTLREFLLENISVSRNRSSRGAERGYAAQEEHRAIVEAIRSGDEFGARTAARIHIDNTGRRLAAAEGAVFAATDDPAPTRPNRPGSAPVNGAQPT